MDNRYTAGFCVVAIVIYMIIEIAHLPNETDINVASLLGGLVIVGVAAGAMLEALLGCKIVLLSSDQELGQLAKYRYQLAIGLVVGLAFAALTCLDLFNVVNVISS